MMVHSKKGEMAVTMKAVQSKVELVSIDSFSTVVMRLPARLPMEGLF